MAKTDYKTIDEYHAAFPAEIADRMQQVRGIVHKEVPGVEEAISYQIPCFKYNGYLLYYAAFAKHLTLSHPFSPQLLQEFAHELKNYKVSKSAIQLPHNEPLPLAFIRKFVQFRKKENEMQPPKKKH